MTQNLTKILSLYHYYPKLNVHDLFFNLRTETCPLRLGNKLGLGGHFPCADKKIHNLPSFLINIDNINSTWHKYCYKINVDEDKWNSPPKGG